MRRVPEPVIEDLVWDDENDEHLLRHGVRSRDLLAILESTFVVLRNKRGQRGPYKLVGRSGNGSLVCLIIEPVSGDPKRWRPVTGWPASRGEGTAARRQGV